MAMRVLYIFESPPFSSLRGQEGLDTVLSGLTIGVEAYVLFIKLGVLQIVKSQDFADTKIKAYTKGFAALPDLGLKEAAVFDSSLRALNLSKKELTLPVEVLDRAAIAQLIGKQDRVFRF